MPSSTSAVAVAVGLLVAFDAQAETVDVTVTTLVAGRQDPHDGNLYSSVPIFENVSLNVSDVRLRYVEDLRLVVAGWGELELLVTDSKLGATGDLDIGYVEGKLFRRRLQLRLGRQIVFGGAARAQPMDGASATIALRRHLALNLYGGAPVTPRFGVHQGDFMAGGRLSWRATIDSEVGLSYIEILNDGLQGRQDLGADGRWRVRRTLVLTGYALLSLIELRLVEADLAANWQPVSALQVGADYRRTSPDLFLPRNSILSVFSQETRDQVGGNVWWRPLSRFKAEADYHLILAEAGVGHDGGARLTATLGPSWQTTVAGEARVLRLATATGYVQGRIYAIERISTNVTATVDLDLYSLEQPINGQTLSFTGAATVGWNLSLHWRAVITGIADTTPEVGRRVECMAKLVYDSIHRVQR